MKKTITMLAVLALFLCLLAGCSCKHTWTEADCLTAKTCSKCQVTEGDALGHDFAAATCTAAETCTRCALTQGEMLGHDFAAATCTAAETCTRCALTQGEPIPHVYGKWTANETDMTRTCTQCNAVESAEIDRELLLNQQLRGHWDFALLYNNGQYMDSNHLNYDAVGPYMRFTDTGEHILSSGAEELRFSLEFQSFEKSEGYELYYALLVFEDGSKTSIMLQHGEQDLLVLFTGENSYIGYLKEDLLNAALAGSWAASKDGSVYTAQLNEDHTFTGDWGGEVAGTWHLRTVSSSYGYRSCTINMQYLKDGVPVVAYGQISLGPDTISLEEYLEQSQYFSFGLSVDQLYLTFHTASEEDIAALQVAQQEGQTKLIGNWISKSVYTYNQDTQSNNTVMTQDYSMTFAQDGTFTAVFDQEYSGTWSFKDASLSYGTITSSYTLTFDGVNEEIHANINGEGELSFHHSQQPLSRTVYLISEADHEQLKQTQAEANSRILGTWNSTSITTSANNASMTKTALDYTITFREDGTFTAGIDQDYAGTWMFSDTYSYNNGATDVLNYQFILSFNDIPHTVDATVTANCLSLSHYENNVSSRVEFVQLTEDELATLKKGPALAEGTWKVVSGDPSVTDYTMTVNADGTFTASFGEVVSGTWSLEGYNSEEGHRYLFRFDNTNSGFLYYLQNEKDFHIWLKQDNDQYIDLVMNKT